MLAIDANAEFAAADTDESGFYLANFLNMPIYRLQFHIDDQIGDRSFFGVVNLAGDIGKVVTTRLNYFFTNASGQFCKTRFESIAECFELFIGKVLRHNVILSSVEQGGRYNGIKDCPGRKSRF